MNKDAACAYTCSLIESISRAVKRTHKEVIESLGYENIRQIYNYSDVFHCEMIEKTADDFITKCNISSGSYDYVARSKYLVPSVWEIGNVFERLIEDVSSAGDNVVDKIIEVLSSWMAERISNYNSDLYYQSREYLAYCYKIGEICE